MNIAYYIFGAQKNVPHCSHNNGGNNDASGARAIRFFRARSALSINSEYFIELADASVNGRDAVVL